MRTVTQIVDDHWSRADDEWNPIPEWELVEQLAWNNGHEPDDLWDAFETRAREWDGR